MKDVQKEIAYNLIEASAGYGRVGLTLLYTSRMGRNSQVAIGNLAIAIEMLLKAFIAKRSLLLLFKNLPKELSCALASSDSMPASFRSIPYEILLKSSAFNSLELNEAVSTFGVFCPELTKRLQAHLKFLSRHRNTCVHAVLPDCREYEVERTAFLFLKLVDHLCKEEPELVTYISWGDDKKNKEFLNRFDEERLKRVHTKIENASEKAKTLTDRMSLEAEVEDWDLYIIKCPVCGSDGKLEGEIQEEFDQGEEGLGDLFLFFTGDRFKCKQCGLKLEDFDELLIAGIDPEIDRSDDASVWMQSHYAGYDVEY